MSERILVIEDDPVYAAFARATRERPDRVAARIGFDEGLAHRIYAGCDLFLMPSRFEPCGLTQMYAMRYGAVPVVRRTGGLADTVAARVPAAWEERLGRSVVEELAPPNTARAVANTAAGAAFREGDSADRGIFGADFVSASAFCRFLPFPFSFPFSFPLIFHCW